MLSKHCAVLRERVLFFSDDSGQLSRAQMSCLLRIKIAILNCIFKVVFAIGSFHMKLREYGVMYSSLHYISNSFYNFREATFNLLFQYNKSEGGAFLLLFRDVCVMATSGLLVQ